MIECPVLFSAVCDRCAWLGPERVSNLTALADFDRHSATHGHRRIELAAIEAATLADELEPEVYT